jgi:hypothetical protein
MNRAHPVALRRSLEMAQMLVKSGLEFVPIPSVGVDDYADLVHQLGDRMSRLALAAELEEGAATADAKPAEPSNRQKIEESAQDNVIVHATLYALRHGMIPSYEEALEQMVLSMTKHMADLRRKLVSAHMHSAVPLCSICSTPIEHDPVTGIKCDCSGTQAPGGSVKP